MADNGGETMRELRDGCDPRSVCFIFPLMPLSSVYETPRHVFTPRRLLFLALLLCRTGHDSLTLPPFLQK